MVKIPWSRTLEIEFFDINFCTFICCELMLSVLMLICEFYK